MKRHALVWLLALVGCGGDDADDEVGTDASSTSDASTDGDSGTSDDESGSSASTTDTGTDMTEDGETGGCPDNPDATPCEACVLAECCEQLLACDASESCSCMFDCVEQGNEQAACLMECGLSGPDLTYGQFVSCVQGKCVDQCP